MMKNLDMQYDEIFAPFTNPRASSVDAPSRGATRGVHRRLIFKEAREALAG